MTPDQNRWLELHTELFDLFHVEKNLSDDEVDERDDAGVRSYSDVLRDLRKFDKSHRPVCPNPRVRSRDGVGQCGCFREMQNELIHAGRYAPSHDLGLAICPVCPKPRAKKKAYVRPR